VLTVAAQNAATMQPIFERLSFLIVCPAGFSPSAKASRCAWPRGEVCGPPGKQRDYQRI